MSAETSLITLTYVSGGSVDRGAAEFQNPGLEDAIFRSTLTADLAPICLAGAFAVLIGGCFGTEVTEFPHEGLEPLEENDVPPPVGTAEDPYPEEFIMVGSEGRRFDTILGRGYIQAPIVDVWDAYRDPAVGADRRTSPDWTSTPLADVLYDDSYVIHHSTFNVINVEWDVTWRHELQEGTDEAPEMIVIRWRKTDGSVLIEVIDGSIVLRPTEDGSATEVELAYHARATEAGLDTYTQYMQDVYNDAVDAAHGRPLRDF